MDIRAVVVGGGYAGLVVARVLAGRCTEVTVVEQDTPGPDPGHRRGTPQSRHPHALLARGAQILEELFPGLQDELTGRGAPVSDFGRFPMLYPTGWTPRVPTGLVLQTFSRPLLEACIRRRVLEDPAVTPLGGTRVTGLALDARRERVTGVRTERHGTLRADLVVIATGRHSRLPAWLAEAGLPAPEVRRVDGRLSYVSRLYKRDTSADFTWQASLQATLAPGTDRGGAVVAIEDGRWLVCLLGADGRTAPTDPDGFAAYAAALANPYVHQVTGTAEPLGPAHRYAGLGNEWHRYDRLRPWPAGLVVLGDALCSLNPLYGHGMTVAAQQAVLLGRTLDGTTALPRVCRRFQRRAGRTLTLPWLMAASLDLGWRPGRTPLPAALAGRLLHRLLRRIPDDPDLYRRFLDVQHLTASPATLLGPALRPARTRRARTGGTTA
ncbi:FAD-dependent oxidoreductase [Streptomyces morookaense]|uniref:FAD-dependent monooxygenase n=1 Tax=Streptomyces morookaense TaxID=1970 RepID=A0A7Y7B6F4_STRMO|nr:FAD-dependent monooxygenase [Streptomyces morookaense]NVK79911.1 FAD-dependent monooxygenase [Streptomyces morookaense]GHF51228.1 hypothetical protein GCM10010359_61980 [Streptomyces morookaense]